MYRTRDWRRAQRQKAMHHLLAWMKSHPHYHSLNKDGSLHRRVVRMADNPKSCSCWMCGNPRKWYNALTKQEMMYNLICEEARREEGIKVH